MSETEAVDGRGELDYPDEVPNVIRGVRVSKYRFVGTESLIDGQHMQSFGQALELEDAKAAALASVHPPALILPDSEFAKCGFNDKELAEHPSVLMHDAAPAEFVAKRNAAWLAAHNWRESLPKEAN